MGWFDKYATGRIITEPLKIMLPIKPVTKKNSSRVVPLGKSGKFMVLPSAAYVQYEKDCAVFLCCKGKNIACPVNIRALFFIDRDGECDASNFYEALADMLVKYKVLADDNRLIVVSWDGSRVFVDRKNPRTEVTIEPLDEAFQLSLTEEQMEEDW